MCLYTIEEIKIIQCLIHRYFLDGREILKKYTDEQQRRIYNGAGPDSWGDFKREILTVFMSFFKPVVFIHDMDFQNSDGTRKGFNIVTKRWKKNCKKMMAMEYPFWTLKQLDPKYRAERLYWLIVMKAANIAISGSKAWKAWQDAFERNKNAVKA